MRKAGKLSMKAKVSIVISTKNEEKNIENCLVSIKNQTVQTIEIIVVDNFSSDRTVEIAKKYTTNVFSKGPERSSQRNFGAKKAGGMYLLFLDADMILSRDVVKGCIQKVEQDPKLQAIIIPEKSYGTSFWAKCKALERSFYVGVDWIEGARFFDRKKFIDLDGYNTKMISGEDWDLHARFLKDGKVSRIKEYILHNEGDLSLLETVKTKYYYAKNIHLYKKLAKSDRFKSQSSVIQRYMLFFSKPTSLFKNPVIGSGMLLMKFCEYSAGAVGYIVSKK